MRATLVADEQRSFRTYKYAKKLARYLEKSGIQTQVWSDGLADAENRLRENPTDLLHLHYHPDARKLRAIMKTAEGFGLPHLVTYHEVCRVPQDRQNHLAKCLSRTRLAIFKTPQDETKALAMNPQMEGNTILLRQPVPYEIEPDFLDKKAGQWDDFVSAAAPAGTIIFIGMIQRQEGLEAFASALEALPESMTGIIAGTIPEGGKKEAQQLKRLFEGNPTISWKPAKRILGRKQYEALADKALFAYIPNGEPHQPSYGGVSLHSAILPFLAASNVLVFSHEGLHTEREAGHMALMLDKPEDLGKTICDLHHQPDRIQARLEQAAQEANRMDWQSLTRAMATAYKRCIDGG